MKCYGFIFLASSLILSACAHEPVAPPAPPEEKKELFLWQPELKKSAPPKADQKIAPAENNAEVERIDLEVVERKLNLSDKFYKLGFHEMSFDPCQFGYQVKNCEKRLFTIINFQVVCRDSEGTVQHTNHILTPFAHKSLHMKVGIHVDDSQTDEKGYGQIKFISKTTAKEARFILSSPPFSLGLHADDAKKIMVPGDWCQ